MAAPGRGRFRTNADSVLGTDLIETRIPGFGIRRLRWGRRGGSLELGDHQIADELRHLGIAREPFITAEYVAQRVAMTFGKRIGSATPYLGYIGEERDLGTYVVRYPNSSPINMYSPFAPTAGPTTVIASAAGPAEEAEPKARTPEPV